MSKVGMNALRCLVLSTLSFAPSAGNTANISSSVDELGDHYVALDGPIAFGDAAKLANEIDKANATGYRLDALRLNSEGGNVWEALEIAIMVRAINNMATAVYKPSICVSACFAIFASGWRKYVNPAPNQIGVHSTSVSDGRETPETTITTTFAARRLSAIGVPDQIIAKIVLTPPNQVYYLTLDDLWAMGVNVTGLPRPAEAGPVPTSRQDPDPLFIARAVKDIGLNGGTIIPAGTLLLIWDQCSRVDGSGSNRTCDVNYRLTDGEISRAQVFQSYLSVINQGWGIRPSAASASPQSVPQWPQPAVKRPFRVVDASGGFLYVRRGPGTDHEVVAKMPMGATGLRGRCVPIAGGYKPFCEVEWRGVTGWASSCCMADLDPPTAPTSQPPPPHTSLAEQIVLECNLPGAGTPGVYVGFGSAWHGFLSIDNSWRINDYSFQKSLQDAHGNEFTITISRSSGAITQQQDNNSRTGSCRLVSKEDRRF